MLNRRGRLISPQHWSQSTTLTNADATTLDVTWYVTHHDRATLTWGGGFFVHNVPLYMHGVFAIQTSPGYSDFNSYGFNVVYNPFLNDDKPDCVPNNLSIFSFPDVTESAVLSHPRPYPPPEGEREIYIYHLQR